MVQYSEISETKEILKNDQIFRKNESSPIHSPAVPGHLGDACGPAAMAYGLLVYP